LGGRDLIWDEEGDVERSGRLPLYRDGQIYDAMNRMTADIAFYMEEARRAAGPVLELACGTGRLTIPIAQSGVEIVGLDLSPSMLKHARAKASAAGVQIEWVEGDCRNFELGRKFALIFLPFNSMQHLHDHSSLEALFRCVRAHLAEGGRFVFDVFNPSIAILNRDPKDRRMEREYEDPYTGGKVRVDVSMHYDDASQVNRVMWYFSREGEPDFRVEELPMRCFFPQELDLLVRWGGFTIEQKSGDFQGKEFAIGDMKQVVVCRCRWEGVMLGTGVRWEEISSDATNLAKHGYSINGIKEWRTREDDAGRRSILHDFYRAHDLCWGCRCTGVRITGFDEDRLEYRYSLCWECGGTGGRHRHE
jgi:SAM-dependent methyltransferase